MTERMQNWRDNKSPDADEEYQALLRALRRKRGFGLFFIQASPAREQKILQQLQTDLPAKRIVTVKLERTSEELFEQLDEVWQQQPVDMFWIEGLEQALLGYEDIKRLAGWQTEDLIHYSWQNVPPILAHLNLGRERFAQRFPCALVFVVPLFVVKYLLRRAADFFDWKSGFFEFPEDVYGEVRDFVAASDYETYKKLDPAVRTQRMLEIKSCLDMPSLETDEQASLCREMGRLFASEGNEEAALSAFDRSLALQPDYHGVWILRGISLDKLGRYEEAIESFDRAVALQPDDHYAWYFRGNSLDKLGRYEEAIESFDRAVALQPDFHYAWYFRGISLYSLGRYEEAIESYDRSLALQPDFHWAIGNRGYTYLLTQKFNLALQDINLAIELDSENDWRHYIRALTHRVLNNPDLAQTDLSTAIHLAQTQYENNPTNWNNTFNLALYHVAANQPDTAQTLYQQALSQNAPIDKIRKAIRDLKEFLIVFPGNSLAQQTLDLLQQSANSETHDR